MKVQDEKEPGSAIHRRCSGRLVCILLSSHMWTKREGTTGKVSEIDPANDRSEEMNGAEIDTISLCTHLRAL
jgi:hypothetical protein